MKVKIVTLKEVMESPTLCISPLRYFDDCHNCKTLLDGIAGVRRLARLQKLELPIEEVVEEAIRNLKCKPNVRPEIIELLKRKEKLLAELKELDEKLERAGKLI